MGVGYYFLKSKSTQSLTPLTQSQKKLDTASNERKIGKQQIIINGNYGYEVTLPDDYYLENFNWLNNKGYLRETVIKDFSNNALLTITYGANGWETHDVTYQNIDGVSFEVLSGPLACGVATGTVGYPKVNPIVPERPNPNLENILTVEIIVNCEGKDATLQSKAIQELVDSIKWSTRLKEILTGKAQTVFIPGSRFGGE